MKRPSHGFTLVELLVVITIIGMLMGLLLPAVNAVREAGRRTTCSNSLYQLSKACLAHAQKLGSFPSGGWGSNWVGLPDMGTGPSQPGGWIYQILPYIDQDGLHDLGKGSIKDSDTGKLAISSSASQTRVSKFIPLLYCPTRRAAQNYPGGGGSTGCDSTSRTDYAINGGSILPSGLPSGTFPHYPGPPVEKTLSEARSGPWPDITTLTFNGIASIRSQVSEAMIPDTKETTYLIGEKYMSPDGYVTGEDPGDLFSAMSGDDVSLIRWGNTSLLPSMDRAANNNPPLYPSQIFGSSHGAGWNAAFCEGHVQLIGWGIDKDIHQYMATRNDHKVIDPTRIPK